MNIINNNNIIKSTRKIKCLGNCIDTGEYYLHPITLALSKNNSTTKKYCPTEFHYDKDGPTYAKQCSKNSISNYDIMKFMALPYLNLNIEQMLEIYKIYNIETLIKWIDIKIDEKVPFQYINRIINIWIKSNYDNLVKTNNIMTDIYIKLNKHYMKQNLSSDNINKYIKNWFKNKDYNDFEFDLGRDLFNNFIFS